MAQLTAAAPIVWTDNHGRFAVAIHTPREGVYRIETSHAGPGGTVIPELTTSLDSETLARTIARIIACTFRDTPSTTNAVTAIDTARNAVVANIDGQLGFLLAGGIADAEAARELQHARSMFDPADSELIARLNADLDARAAQAQPVTDPAVDYIAQLTNQRHKAITNAVTTADRQPATLTGLRNAYAAAAGTTPRNRVTLRPGTSRALSDAMWRMLADANARGGQIRLDSRDLRNRARAIDRRFNYLNLIYFTDGVPASLYLAEITDAGRKALAQHQQTAQAVA